MDKINFVNNSEPALSAENLNQMQDNIENGIRAEKLKTKVFLQSFNNVGNSNETGVNVDFSTMFPNLNASDVVAINVEIINVYETWDRTFANMLYKANNIPQTLQIRSYATTQQITVRITAFYY